MNQGQHANLTGKFLENQVQKRVSDSGYDVIENKKFDINTTWLFNNIYIKHCYICDSIYDTKMYTDILLFHKDKHPNKLAIEIKWQQVPGSVDEKYPYIVENIKHAFPCPAIIILDGGGYKIGAKQWLKRQIDDKLIGVYSLVEFMAWANNGGI